MLDGASNVEPYIYVMEYNSTGFPEFFLWSFLRKLWLPASRRRSRGAEPPIVSNSVSTSESSSPFFDQERMDVAALAVAEAVNPRRELRQDALAGARQGAKGFSTPSSVGSSSGKCRSRSVRIELLSTQSMPSAV